MLTLFDAETREYSHTLKNRVSVTRFGEVLPPWQNFTSLWQNLTVYFLFGKLLSLLCKIWYIIGLILIVANGQILKNNLTIWSHCTELIC